MKRLICAALAAALLAPTLLTVKARAQDDAPPAPPQDESQSKDMPNGDGHDADHRDSDSHDADHPDGGRRGGRMDERLKKRLGLSDDQLAKFKDATKAHMESARSLGKQEHQSLDAVRDAIKNKASDDDVQKALDALKSARKAMMDEHEKYVESLSFLTATQRGKLLLEEMRMRERGGMGGERDRRGGDRGGDRHDD